MSTRVTVYTPIRVTRITRVRAVLSIFEDSVRRAMQMITALPGRDYAQDNDKRANPFYHRSNLAS